MHSGLTQNRPDPGDARLIALVRDQFDMPRLREQYELRFRGELEKNLSDEQLERHAQSVVRREDPWLESEELESDPAEREVQRTIENIRSCIQNRVRTEVIYEVHEILLRLSPQGVSTALAQVVIDSLGPEPEDLDRRFGAWLLRSIRGITCQLEPHRLGDAERSTLEKLYLSSIRADETMPAEVLQYLVSGEFAGSPECVLALSDLAIARYTPEYAAGHSVQELLAGPIVVRGHKELRGWRPLQDHVIATLNEVIQEGMASQRGYPDLIRIAVREFLRPDLMESRALLAAAYRDIERLAAAGELKRIAAYAELIAETRSGTAAGESWRRLARSFATEVEPLVQAALRETKRAGSARMAALKVHPIFCGTAPAGE